MVAVLADDPVLIEGQEEIVCFHSVMRLTFHCSAEGHVTEEFFNVLVLGKEIDCKLLKDSLRLLVERFSEGLFRSLGLLTHGRCHANHCDLVYVLIQEILLICLKFWGLWDLLNIDHADFFERV